MKIERHFSSAAESAPDESIRALADALRGFLPQEACDIFQDEFSFLVQQRRLAITRDIKDSQITIINVATPDSLARVTARYDQDIDQTARMIGRRVLRRAAEHVMDACDRSSVFGFDPVRNINLRHAIDDVLDAGLEAGDVERILSYARQGYEQAPFFRPGFEAEDDIPFSKTILSLPDDFMETAITGHGFFTPDGHIPAADYLEKTAESIWASGAPIIRFRDRLESSDPVFAALAVLDLSLCTQAGNASALDLKALAQAVRVAVLALAAVGGPSDLRLCGFASLLLSLGVAYDSDAGRSVAGLLSGFVTAVVTIVQAELAAIRGGDIPANDAVLMTEIKDRIIRLSDEMGRLSSSGKNNLSRPLPFRVRDAAVVDAELAKSVLAAWQQAQDLAKLHGLNQNIQVSVAPAGELDDQLITTARGVRPESSLIQIAAAEEDLGYARRLHPAAVNGLRRLGYSARQIDDIHAYAVGHGTLLDAPFLSHAELQEKGLSAQTVARIEQALQTAQHVREAFRPAILDIDTDNDVLQDLGYSAEQIDAANLYVCGSMTFEGAPHLRPEHLHVFDCLLPSVAGGVRHISPEAQLRMQAAVESGLTGRVEQVITLHPDTTIDQVHALVIKAWELGLKQIEIYRDGCISPRPVSLLVSQQPVYKAATVTSEDKKQTTKKVALSE